jgi:ribosomal protein S18 acetylase RimI-like enzyme
LTTDLSKDVPPECIFARGEDWMLVHPVPEHLAEAAAQYSVAQRETLKVFVGSPEKRQEVLGHRVRTDRICIALVKGEVAGCLSYRMDGAGSVWPEPKRFREHFGPVGGTIRWLLTELTLRRGHPDELYIEGFKVDPKARGRGIGTNLLKWLAAEVVRNGKRAWRTEASASADAAIRVYTGVGGQIVKTLWFGPLGHLFDRPKIVVIRWPAPGAAGDAATAPQGAALSPQGR